MEYENILLHNVAEVIRDEDGGIFLRKYPSSVSERLNAPIFNDDGSVKEIYTGGREVAKNTGAIELRVVTRDECAVTLCADADTDVLVYWGEFFHQRIRLIKGKISTERITRPVAWDKLRSGFDTGRFSPDVLRIMFCRDGIVKFYSFSFSGAHRIPCASELPAKTMLAYGTSITHGSISILEPVSYVEAAGTLLGYDVMNKALAGSCFSEPEVAEYLTSLSFDVGYFEIGTNIASRPEEFIERRAGALIDAVCEKFPEKPLFFVTPFPALGSFSDMYSDWNDGFKRTGALIACHAKKYRNAFLIAGEEILTRPYYLAADVLHPSVFGHAAMGHNLAAAMSEKLAGFYSDKKSGAQRRN